jgi:hypothetical protein
MSDQLEDVLSETDAARQRAADADKFVNNLQQDHVPIEQNEVVAARQETNSKKRKAEDDNLSLDSPAVKRAKVDFREWAASVPFRFPLRRRMGPPGVYVDPKLISISVLHQHKIYKYDLYLEGSFQVHLLDLWLAGVDPANKDDFEDDKASDQYLSARRVQDLCKFLILNIHLTEAIRLDFKSVHDSWNHSDSEKRRQCRAGYRTLIDNLFVKFITEETILDGEVYGQDYAPFECSEHYEGPPELRNNVAPFWADRPETTVSMSYLFALD